MKSTRFGFFASLMGLIGIGVASTSTQPSNVNSEYFVPVKYGSFNGGLNAFDHVAGSKDIQLIAAQGVYATKEGIIVGIVVKE